MTAEELERYMRLYYRNVYSAALCYCKNPSDADDITQDVFFKLYTYSGTFTGDEHVKAWLLRCAVNRSINLIHSHWYRFSGPLDEANESISETAADEGGELLALIMKLERKNRTALYLYYYEHYTISEISRITGASETAVRSRLARGRKQLRKLIESYNA